MPPKSAESLLFHKKKAIKKEPSTPSTTSQGSQPSQSQQSQSQQSLRKSVTPRVQPIPPAGDADDSSKLPDGEFSEFKLMSSALNGWKYDVMKFDSRKTIDISTWEEPIKLNRKELRREEPGSSSQVPAGHMLGPDGKPVVGSDGNIVMVDADGRPIAKDGAEAQSKDKDKGKAGGRKKFQKKTRQVFLVPEAVRQLRREERYPWVMEDAKQNEMWVGRLEEVARAETHALFMPAAQEFFKFVPANRWYKFQKKPKHHIPGLEEAEAMMAKRQKNKEPERWLLQRKGQGQGLSSATSEMFKAEAENRVVSGSSSLVYSSGQSRAVGGRALRTTNRGAHGGGDDDDEGGPRRKKEENDMEGDLDEQLFDDEFADDDEAGPADMDEEEAKELEERLKREYKSANKTREGYVDESESEDGESQLTKDGKSLKKLMRKLEKNAAYDSDEERNPYASSNDEEEDEEEPIPPQEPTQETKSRSASQQPTPKPSQLPTSTAQNGSAVGSRATSPAPASMGGHSVVAKRATSPKAPKLKTTSTNNGRVTSGQGTGSRATSPVTGSRATSPSPLAKGPGSPTSNGQPTSNKRKAADELGGNAASAGAAVNGAPKPKKRKPLPTGPPPDGELEEKMLVKWLQNTPNATTRDCIQHFTPYLTTDAKKAKFTAMVKEVAQLRGGILILRNSEASAAASPTS